MSQIQLTARPQWLALKKHFAQTGGRHLREMFASDPRRGERFSVEAAGLYLDYSKQRISTDTPGPVVRTGRSLRRAEAYRSDVPWRTHQHD